MTAGTELLTPQEMPQKDYICDILLDLFVERDDELVHQFDGSILRAKVFLAKTEPLE